jgi:hypothetical protein
MRNATRAARSSLADLENKYNRAIERSAILESELEGKSVLIVQVQRLKDELEGEFAIFDILLLIRLDENSA